MLQNSHLFPIQVHLFIKQKRDNTLSMVCKVEKISFGFINGEIKKNSKAGIRKTQTQV